jgi:molybdenum cofactor cytidylyltransferase
VIAGAILAAGEGRRFGGPKQLADLDGRPLLEYAIRAMVAVPAIERIAVVIGSHAEEIREQVDVYDAEWVVCEEWREGMAASLRAAIRALEPDDPEALVITLGDQPFITPQVIAAILTEVDDGDLAARAVYDGQPGHPVIVTRDLLPVFGEVRGDEGARRVLEARGVRRWECGHLCRNDDVDTPEDLEAARQFARSPGEYPL